MQQRPAEARFWPTSVRSRLLLAFAVIFASAMALALVGWMGIRDTRDALRDFQSHVLPDVSRSLELSQRIAAIAAMAPYVAESTRPFQLQAEAQALLIRAIETEAANQPGARLAATCAPAVAEAARPLAERLAGKIGARFSIQPDDALRRDRFEVKAL